MSSFSRLSLVLLAVIPLPAISEAESWQDEPKKSEIRGTVVRASDRQPVTGAKVSLLSVLVLAGTGVPLIVVGAKKVPAYETSVATFTPWVAPRAAGLGLRLQL